MTLVRACPAMDFVLDASADLELPLRPMRVAAGMDVVELAGPSGESILIDLRTGRLPLLEQVLRSLRFDFDSLPLLVRGDSKELRLLTPRIALARLLPTVYSFTHNRYGVVPGSAAVRARFSAEIFRRMAAEPKGHHVPTAFLGLVESRQGPLLAEEVVEICNLEVRVKRYHIGSPVHRYQFVERHLTARGGPPLYRWARFEQPLVCFDWRHPLLDESGHRLADEPLSDDYAAIWIDDVSSAKRLAQEAFAWIEQLFARVGLLLIDICFFIDRAGAVLYGEISPDCMRVRAQASNDSEAFDKDRWRAGGKPREVLERYERIYEQLFGSLPASLPTREESSNGPEQEIRGTDGSEEPSAQGLSGWDRHAPRRSTQGTGHAESRRPSRDRSG